MVEIRYDDNSQQADLAGKSVAEAREQYQAVFDIPDKARARLNDKEVKPKQEPQTLLSDGDELFFEVKRLSRKPLLVGALMLALALSGGMFAYTYTTASITGTTLTAIGADFATVNASSAFDWWYTDNETLIPDIDPAKGLVGRISGAMSTANTTLFTVCPTDNYTGDIEIKVYLANAGHLRRAFKHFNMMLECHPSEELSDNLSYLLLTLQNAEVLFHWNQPGNGSTSNITIVGGSWHTLSYDPLPWSASHECYPKLYCEVQPR